MSKTLWHTIQIKVPKEMLELTKSGKVSIKKTLTKTLNISRSQKTPAIKLIPSDVNKPQIVNDGKEWNIDVLKERMAKARAMRKKNANKNVFEPAVKKMNPILEGNIINRARELGEESKKQVKKTSRKEKAQEEWRKKWTKKQISDDDYNKQWEENDIIDGISNKISDIRNRASMYGYFSKEDALYFIELHEQLSNLTGSQQLFKLTGKKLTTISGTKIGIVKESYKNN